MAQQHLPQMAAHPSPRKLNLVGSRIRELPKGRNLTQTELSEKIGVAQSDLSRMEQGEYKVGLDTLFKLLQVFDLKISEFFGESDTTGPEDRELVSDYRELSDEGRQEVRDFMRFKRMQEQARDDEPDRPGDEKQ
jgi:transcriptional regulator with XRE-family HTH domain